MSDALNAAPFAVTQDGDWLRGPWRAPVNIAAHAKGTIHDDDTAQALGLRGGTVAGSIHLQQCAPMGRVVFGDAWDQQGSLSLYFRHATRGGEPVRVSLRPRSPGHAEMALHTPDGLVVAVGAAASAFDPDCPVRRRLAKVGPPPDSLKILRSVSRGAVAERRADPILRTRNDADRATLTEPLPPDPIGGPRTLPYNLMIDVLRAVEPALAPLPDGVVGLYGAIALAWFDGPLREETPYRVTGVVRALMETPQTEGLWYESEAFDEGGVLKARMLLLARVMKASSPLWGPF